MDTIDKVRIIESDAAAKEDAAAEKVMATIFHTDGTRERYLPPMGRISAWRRCREWSEALLRSSILKITR